MFLNKTAVKDILLYDKILRYQANVRLYSWHSYFFKGALTIETIFLSFQVASYIFFLQKAKWSCFNQSLASSSPVLFAIIFFFFPLTFHNLFTLDMRWTMSSGSIFSSEGLPAQLSAVPFHQLKILYGTMLSSVLGFVPTQLSETFNKSRVTSDHSLPLCLTIFFLTVNRVCYAY